MDSVANIFIMISKNCDLNSGLKMVYFIKDHVECFSGAETEVIIGIFSNLLNLRDSFNCTTFTTIRRTVRKIITFRTSNRICGEEFTDISTQNILTGTIFDFQENILDIPHYASDDKSSYFFPTGSMRNASDCPIIDFTIYNSIPYQING